MGRDRAVLGIRKWQLLYLVIYQTKSLTMVTEPFAVECLVLTYHVPGANWESFCTKILTKQLDTEAWWLGKDI